MALRVFVSVGTHPQQFDRLLKEVDRLVVDGKLKAGVFAQTGNSEYRPSGFEFKKFVNAAEYEKRMQEANVVVSHGGAGTIINALRMGKKLVVVPRLEKFSEHTNDHQLDLAQALQARGKCIAVFDIKDLGKAIERAKNFKPSLASEREKLVKRIGQFLES